MDRSFLVRLAGFVGVPLWFAPGCCCDQGADRLVDVRIEGERFEGGEVGWGGRVHLFPVDGYFRASRVGTPGGRKLRTIPMLELYDEDGMKIELDRYLALNEGGCAKLELYEPPTGSLTVGETYTLVHRESAAPGDLEDTGTLGGEWEGSITTFAGERALVAEIRAQPASPMPTAGAGGGGGFMLGVTSSSAASGAGGAGGMPVGTGGAGGGGGASGRGGAGGVGTGGAGGLGTGGTGGSGGA